MSDYGPGEPVDIEAEGVTTVELNAVSIPVTDFDQALADLSSTTTLDDALRYIDTAERVVAGGGSPAEKIVAQGLLDDLREGIESGAVQPSEAGAAVKWSLARLGTSRLTAKIVLGGGLVALLYLWGAQHGRTLHDPTTAPKPVTTTTIVTGPQGEGTNTPGGRLVNYGQSGIKKVTTAYPGGTKAQAAAISTSLAQTYQNSLLTMIRVANGLTGQIDAVGDLAAKALGAANTAYKDATTAESKLTASINSLNATITRLDNAITTLDGRIANVEKEVTTLRNQPPTTGIAPSPVDTTAIAAGVTGSILSAGIFATKVDFNTLQGEIDTQTKQLQSLESEVNPTGAPNLPTTLSELEDCCAENADITNPIRQGGATPSQLSQLGSLLTNLAAIGIAIGAINILDTILDADAAILGTIQGAEYVVNLVDGAVGAVEADWSWADAIANG